MGENTAIEWAKHTFNPWVGCTRVSPACDHCYAENWAVRTGQPQLWNGERRRTTPGNWAKPIKWDKAAAAVGERHRVFCASLADVFDNQVPEIWRSDLFALVEDTPKSGTGSQTFEAKSQSFTADNVSIKGAVSVDGGISQKNGGLSSTGTVAGQSVTSGGLVLARSRHVPLQGDVWDVRLGVGGLGVLGVPMHRVRAGGLVIGLEIKRIAVDVPAASFALGQVVQHLPVGAVEDEMSAVLVVGLAGECPALVGQLHLGLQLVILGDLLDDVLGLLVRELLAAALLGERGRFVPAADIDGHIEEPDLGLIHFAGHHHALVAAADRTGEDDRHVLRFEVGPLGEVVAIAPRCGDREQGRECIGASFRASVNAGRDAGMRAPPISIQQRGCRTDAPL